MADFILESTFQTLPNNSQVLYVCAQGMLNKNSSYQFEKFFQSIISEKKAEKVILAFADLATVDSTGLGLLASIQEKCIENGIRLKLVGIPPKIHHLFEMLGMDSYFDIFETKEAALQSFQRSVREKSGLLDTFSETQRRKPVVRTFRKKKEKRPKTTKAFPKEKRQKPLIIQIEYYQKMLTLKNFPLQVTLSSRNRQEDPEEGAEAKFIEITPQIPGCLITPNSRRIEESEYHQVSFCVTPLVPSNGKNSEILISKNQVLLKQLSLPLAITTRLLAQMSVFSGILSFLVFCIPGIAAFLIRRSISPLAGDIEKIANALDGGYLFGFLSLVLFLGIAAVFYHYSRPVKAEPLVYIWEQ